MQHITPTDLGGGGVQFRELITPQQHLLEASTVSHLQTLQVGTLYQDLQQNRRSPVISLLHGSRSLKERCRFGTPCSTACLTGRLGRAT